MKEKARPHQPGQAVFRAILSEEIEWKSFAASGEYVTQVTAIGPLGLEYVDPKDDPRNAGSGVRS
jgi:hypothetical protein